MRIWAKTIQHQKIQSEVVREFSLARPSDLEGWMPVLHELCQALDLSRPVVLEKHVRELDQFSHTVFRSSDFMEPIRFDRFEIEIFPEKKEHETFDRRSY
ncbi:MAG: hypothetical protein Q4B07_03950 [Clostridia bacterium]|nr:hypothetical protein [Clostridia bacterium]